ncbi:MAG: Ureidoglycolate lyase [Sclerophora amabilis]|nr:MAG: Ureidoglycolate lyase [Sclerophora amabilis]
MPSSIQAPSPSLRVTVEALTSETFSPFGSAVAKSTSSSANKSHHRSPSQSVATAGVAPTTNAVPANQGTALKYTDVFSMETLYKFAPSRKRARVAMNRFVCSPRELKPDTKPGDGPSHSQSQDDIDGLFPIKILERHPFTSQTFIPLGVSALNKDARYLVIVAPTLPPSRNREPRPPPFPNPPPRKKRSFKEIFSRARPPPFPEDPERPLLSVSASSQSAPAGRKHLPGPGPPDLQNIKAFIADGSQAITYKPGTWHAPMVVLGKEAIDFVVVHHVNGVSSEDCQEAEIVCTGVEEELVAVIPKPGRPFRQNQVKAKL